MGFLQNMVRDGLERAIRYPAGGLGVRITPMLTDGGPETPYEHAMAYYSNAFRACLLAKSRPLSSLPIHVYKRENGVRRPVSNRAGKALEAILRGRWNPYLTGSEGIRWVMDTKDTLGEAFVRVEWDAHGRPAALWPMSGMPEVDTTRPGRPVFRYGGDTFTAAGSYLQHEVVWVKSPILDAEGLHGVSLAKLAASELGLSIDLEKFYERLIKNGNHFPGWLESANSLKEADVKKVQQQLDDHKGMVGVGAVRIFDNGLTYHQTPLTMADMSLVDQERWILQQTCRTLSVPPQEVFDLSNATYSNIEQGALNFANKTLVPECVALEQALGTILESAGATDCYVQFDMNGLLRGSYRDRMEGYRVSIMAGFKSPNEVRAMEDDEPYEGGDVFLRPSAYAYVDPETGDATYPARSSNGGYSGEGYQRTDGEPEGRPSDLAPVYRDMEARIAARFAERGDTPQTREFAARVLRPYADACLMNRIEYDLESDIERMAEDARH